MIVVVSHQHINVAIIVYITQGYPVDKVLKLTDFSL